MEIKKLVIGVSIALAVLVVLVGAMLLYNPVVDDGVYVGIRSNTEYFPTEQGQVIAELLNRSYGIINASCYLTVLYPDKTTFINNVSMGVSDGMGTKYLSFTVPEVIGVYEYQVTCNVSSRRYVSGKSFHVSELNRRVDQLTFGLTNVDGENIDTAYMGQLVYSRWRASNGNIYRVSCEKGNTTIDQLNESFTVAWNARNISGIDNVTCQVNISFPNTLGISWPGPVSCYQEYANQSNYCGGLSGGNYTRAGNVFDDTGPPNGQGRDVTDGNWATASRPGVTGGSGPFNITIVYIKPDRASQNLTFWQVKDFGFTGNLSIPMDCWDYYSDKLVLFGETEWTPSMYNLWSCYNGTFKTLSINTGVTPKLYEEAMIWGYNNRIKDVTVVDFINVLKREKNLTAWAQR